MKIKNAIAAAIGTIMSFTLLSVGASAGTLPFGVQIGVDKTTVQNDWGWSECFSTSGSSFGSSLAGIQSSCTGNYLMLATYVNGSDDYAILAGAAHADCCSTPASRAATLPTSIRPTRQTARNGISAPAGRGASPISAMLSG